MSEVNAPKFQYPVAGTILTFARTMRYWSRRKNTLGGMRESATGTARAAFTIRRDYLLDIVLRFPETELSNVEAMHAWMEDNIGTAFRFWPDVAVTGTSFDCYLVAPVQGEDLAPTRADLPSDLEVTLTIRRTNGASFGLSWYSD